MRTVIKCDFNQRDSDGNVVGYSKSLVFRDLEGDFECDVEVVSAKVEGDTLMVHAKPIYSTLKYKDE